MPATTPRLSKASTAATSTAGAITVTLASTITAASARANRVSAGRATNRRRQARVSRMTAAAQAAISSVMASSATVPTLSRAKLPRGAQEVARRRGFGPRADGGLAPEGGIEQPGRAHEQPAGQQGAPALVDAVVELVGAQRQQARLLERRVELAALGGEALALGGERRILGRRGGGRRLAELLEPDVDLGEARLERLDLAAQLVAQRRDPGGDVGQRLVAAGAARRLLGELERRLERIERRHQLGVGPRALGLRQRRRRQRAGERDQQRGGTAGYEASESHAAIFPVPAVSRGRAAVSSGRGRHEPRRIGGRAFNWPALCLSCGGAREDEMTVVETRSGGASERDRFIPVRKADILDALIGHGRLRGGAAEQFRRLARLLGAIYHYEYFDRLETLRNDYFYFNPDLPHDMAVDPAVLARAHDEMVATLVGVLQEADFVEVSPDDLARSHRERHALKVEIAIPPRIIARSASSAAGIIGRRPRSAEWFGLRRREVEIDVYDHLVLMVMVKPEGEIASARLRRHLAKSRLRPGTILIKYFRDIARSDLNMLFPDVRVVLSLFDKLFLGLPGIAGGIPLLLKLLPAVSVLFAVIAAYLGVSGTVHEDDTRQALAAVSALVALGGYLTRQWLKYQRQSLKYQKEISDNVYFRNINNNAGALDYIVGAAEEQECKEAFLAYYFLATAAAPMTQERARARGGEIG